MATSIEYFAEQPEIKELLKNLNDNFRGNGNNLKVSDLEDDEGHQYVNLVQEGGGMLGIALVGYTYILEIMGIRFWRLAGTSAGAINSVMLASIGEKTKPKV